MFGETLRLLPQRPIPRLHSPYLDDRLFADIRGPRLDEAVAIIEQQLGALHYPWPRGLDRAATIKQTARGLYSRLLSILPREVWSFSSTQLRARTAAAIDPSMIGEVVAQLRRVFCVGQLRARSYDLQEDLLVAPEKAARAWQVSGTAKAKLTQANTPNDPHAELEYDFSKGDTVYLSQTFTTSFPIERLHRLQLSLRYDDTWHALTLYMEKKGQRYRAAHALESSDYEWIVDTWRRAGRMIARTKFAPGRCWSRCLTTSRRGRGQRLRLQGLTTLRLRWS